LSVVSCKWPKRLEEPKDRNYVTINPWNYQWQRGFDSNASEAVKKLGAVDRPEGYLQNCRMRTLKMYGS
jgi:hypothetical protein